MGHITTGSFILMIIMNYSILYILHILHCDLLKADETFTFTFYSSIPKHTIKVSGISYNGVSSIPSIGVLSKASVKIAVK